MASETKADRAERVRHNLTTAEAKIFVAMVRGARGDSRVLTNVTNAHDTLGLPASWMRERMAGRIRIKPVDLEILERLLSIAKTGSVEAADRKKNREEASLEVAKYRNAIGKMCRSCAPDPKRGETEQFCPDSVCPLRSVSPLRLSEKAWGPPIVGKDWGR